MKILSIDTSSNLLSIAVVDDKQNVLGKYECELDRNSSSHLIPMIKHLLSEISLSINSITGFAISIGPGSFTGLRVGVTTIKGLALVLKKPIAAIPTLDVVAYNALKTDNTQIIVPILDARRNKVYSAIYKKGDCPKRSAWTIPFFKKTSKDLLIELPDLLKKLPKNKNIIFLGDGLKLYQKDIEKTIGKRAVFYKGLWYPKAEIVGKLSIDYFKTKKIVDADALTPLYLHPRDCNVRKQRGLDLNI